MTASLNPGLVLILGALVVPFLRGPLKAAWMLMLPVAGFAVALGLEPGLHGQIQVFALKLVTLRVDKLALAFSYVFLIAAFVGILFSLNDDDPVQQVSGLIYAGAAIAAVFAGDLATLFVYWELTAIASVFLIWARGTDRAYRAGMRYLIIQVGSGVILFSGALLHFSQTGSLEFGRIGTDGLGGKLILLAFGIKCAFPLLHSWLEDAYPEATVGGTVMLSAFTTKLAVYALARGYAGTEFLIWIGAAMTAFPIFYAVIENDLRRVLAYSLNNQLGFMVVGVGVGTEMAINGTVAHAFSHILYKALLFMSMGAVLYRTGTVKATELGGLYRTMPWTMGFCCVGAASISAFPLFSGFISKAMIITAAADGGYWGVWAILLFASAGVFHHSGIKIPFFAFFAHDSGKRPAEAPLNMLIAMGIAAALCIGIGVWPKPLYDLLPFAVDFKPYTAAHVITQLQLLLFSALAFAFLMRTGLYPPELRSVNIDVEIVYRKFLPWLVRHVGAAIVRIREEFVQTFRDGLAVALRFVHRHHGPDGALARILPTGSMVFVVVLLLAGYLVLYLTRG